MYKLYLVVGRDLIFGLSSLSPQTHTFGKSCGGTCTRCTTIVPDMNGEGCVSGHCIKDTIGDHPSFCQFGSFRGCCYFFNSFVFLRWIPWSMPSISAWCNLGIEISLASWGQLLVIVSQSTLCMQLCHIQSLHFVRMSVHTCVNHPSTHKISCWCISNAWSKYLRWFSQFLQSVYN